MLFNQVADIDWLGEFKTLKDLWNEIHGLSSTSPVFKYFQGLEFRRKNSSTFKDFQDAWEPYHYNHDDHHYYYYYYYD